jgi:hypothetical protein
MSWMKPDLSLSLEAGLRSAQLQLQKLPREELIARAEHFMGAAAVNHHLLNQAMRRIAELEIEAASAQARQSEPRPRWPWQRQGG